SEGRSARPPALSTVSAPSIRKPRLDAVQDQGQSCLEAVDRSGWLEHGRQSFQRGELTARRRLRRRRGGVTRLRACGVACQGEPDDIRGENQRRVYGLLLAEAGSQQRAQHRLRTA